MSQVRLVVPLIIFIVFILILTSFGVDFGFDVFGLLTPPTSYEHATYRRDIEDYSCGSDYAWHTELRLTYETSWSC